MACTAHTKRPGEKGVEGRLQVPKVLKIEGKHEEEEEEEVEGENEEVEEMEEEGEEEENEEYALLSKQQEKLLSEYALIFLKEIPLEDGWETDGKSCFHGRYVHRSELSCTLRIDYDDVMSNKDLLKQYMTYCQELIQSEGFDLETVPPRYHFIRKLNYDAEDECMKESIDYHVRLLLTLTIKNLDNRDTWYLRKFTM